MVRLRRLTRARQDATLMRVKEPLQALILADSYDERFRPISLERPRCLIPVANAPPLSYAIEFLSSAGVQEIFVFCTAHADQIDECVAAPSHKLHTHTYTDPHTTQSTQGTNTIIP